MTDTEKKIEALLFESPWRSAIAHIAKWHDSEMGKLKERLIGVVKRNKNLFPTVTYYDGGDIVTTPSRVVADVVKEMEAVYQPAEPLSPFGCKCWRFDEQEESWIRRDSTCNSQFYETSELKEFKLCPFCGKARVEKP